MSELVSEKVLLRSQLRARRKQMTQTEHASRSAQLNQYIIAYIQRHAITEIKGFIPYAGEPNIWETIHYCWNNSITFIVPKCEVETKTMSWYSVEHEEQLTKGAYNILEPNPNVCRPYLAEVKHILVPALSFTNKGDRLGYGGGYYDRYYEQANSKIEKWIGISFQNFIEAQLPTEEHDFKCNIIMTDAGFIDYKVEEKED